MQGPSENRIRVTVNAVAFVGMFFILAGLVWIMYYYTQPGPVDESRWAERKKNLAEVNAQNAERLQNYTWIDAKRGVVSLAVSRAVELTIQEWQSPAEGRANLLARMEKFMPPVVAATGTNPPAGLSATNTPAVAAPK
jgi:hypothetical protein